MIATHHSPSGLVFRPAAERFHSQFDWLDSWHTFSFATHSDPAWMGFGALRVINDDTIAPGRGFGLHPHREMEIITVMVEGQLNHHDSMGHSAVLHAVEVQRMSAGTGLVHSEMNGGERPCRLLQIWVEPSSAGLPPAYEQKSFQLKQGWTPLLDPQRANDAMAIHRPLRLWRARPLPGETLPITLGAGERAWIQMITGSADFKRPGEAQIRLERGDGLGFQRVSSDGAEATVSPGAQGADLLLFVFA